VEVDIAVQAIELGQRLFGAAPCVARDGADAPIDAAPLDVPLAGEGRDIFRDARGDEALPRSRGSFAGVGVDQRANEYWTGRGRTEHVRQESRSDVLRLAHRPCSALEAR